MGVLEGGIATAGKVVDTFRTQPLALAMGIMNIALLVFLFYYLSRISTRSESTSAHLFQANDKLFAQWGEVVSDTHKLMERNSHCILPEDALKLINSGIATYGVSPLGRTPLNPSEPAKPSDAP